MRHYPDADPASLTPDQRRQEVAAILARGILRLRDADRAAVSAKAGRPDTEAESAQNRLDSSSVSSPPVAGG